MSYMIIGDTALELLEEMKTDSHFKMIPFIIEVGNYKVIDDENLNMDELLIKIADSVECAKTACPSPDSYLEAFHQEVDNIYVITISSQLSGSNNSAQIAKNMYEEEHGNKNICIIDSLTAAGPMTVIAMKIQELEAQGKSFEEISESIMEFRDNLKTIFVLDNLETLRKNGRLSKMQSVLAGAFNIKLVLIADKTGNIVPVEKARGKKKALIKLIEQIEKQSQGGQEDKDLVISHCKALEDAKWVKSEIENKFKFRRIEIVEVGGLSGTYANVGGVIVGFVG